MSEVKFDLSVAFGTEATAKVADADRFRVVSGTEAKTAKVIGFSDRYTAGVYASSLARKGETVRVVWKVGDKWSVKHVNAAVPEGSLTVGGSLAAELQPEIFAVSAADFLRYSRLARTSKKAALYAAKAVEAERRGRAAWARMTAEDKAAAPCLPPWEGIDSLPAEGENARIEKLAALIAASLAKQAVPAAIEAAPAEVVGES